MTIHNLRNCEPIDVLTDQEDQAIVLMSTTNATIILLHFIWVVFLRISIWKWTKKHLATIKGEG
jgi:hypothetical protein